MIKKNELTKLLSKTVTEKTISDFEQCLLNDKSEVLLNYTPSPETYKLDELINSQTSNMTGCFNSIKDQWNFINYTLLSNIDEITERMNKLPDKHFLSICRKIPQYDKNNKPINIGTGFIKDDDGFIQKFTTHEYVGIVLRKDNSMPLGFSIKEAYPGIVLDRTKEDERYKSFIDEACKNLNISSKNCIEELRKTPTYKQSTPAKRAYLEYKANPLQVNKKAHMQLTGYEDDVLTYMLRINNKEYYKAIFDEENGCKLRKIKEYEGIQPIDGFEEIDLLDSNTKTNPPQELKNTQLLRNCLQIAETIKKGYALPKKQKEKKITETDTEYIENNYEFEY